MIHQGIHHGPPCIPLAASGSGVSPASRSKRSDEADESDDQNLQGQKIVFFLCSKKYFNTKCCVYIYNKWYLLVLSHDTISSPCPVKKGLYILISPWFLSAPPCTGHGPWALGPKTGRVVVHGQEVLQLGFSNSEGTYRTSLTSYRNLCSISTYGTSWDIITMLHVLSSSQVGWCSKYWVSHLNSY